jgi:Cys-tRNA(Pro)/Cys-tRNA(Cys) deacylase
MAAKTSAVRLLDQLKIRYELREYDVDPNDLAAESVAAKIGLPAEQVFKTLVARGERNRVCMAIIPGDQELNLKALAGASGDRKVELVAVKELQSLTGYIRGGVTALAAKRDFPVYVDETIQLFDVISISAGMCGLQILLSPVDYLKATKGTMADLSQPKSNLHARNLHAYMQNPTSGKQARSAALLDE